jgi:O-ureido-D-serine cyclo-ligase
MLHAGRPPAYGLYVEEEIERRSPTERERAIAEDILDSLRWDRRELLYARVDLIPDDSGEPRLVELELAEPSLFFSYRDGAAAQLADAVVARL